MAREEVAHTLRLLEIMGRTDMAVMKGAAFPLVRHAARDSIVGAAVWQSVVRRSVGRPLVA